MEWIIRRSTSCIVAKKNCDRIFTVQSKDHMKLTMFYSDHAMKIAANLLQSHILIVTGSCKVDVEFYALCNPITSKCFVLGLLNIDGSKVCLT